MVSYYSHLMFFALTASRFHRTSATNCARIYNQSFAPAYIKSFLPSDWQPRLTLYYDDVWNAFFVHTLLLNHTSCGTLLQLPNKAKTQEDRLRVALEARNEQMKGTGQTEWSHACEKCTNVFSGEDGGLRKYCICISLALF
jgi:hypothetical protein